MSTTANFFRKQSWGALQFSWSITPIIKLPYNGNACGSRTALAAWSGGDPSAIDMMAFAAASARGFNRNSFDFQLIFVPICRATGWSGIGWIGAPGAVIWTYAVDYDGSVAHEMVTRRS
jgi:hypothetical protein